jgi:hypothetical protein
MARDEVSRNHSCLGLLRNRDALLDRAVANRSGAFGPAPFARRGFFRIGPACAGVASLSNERSKPFGRPITASLQEYRSA